MPLQKIMAQVSCADLTRSTEWFATIFDRKPDDRPMDHYAGGWPSDHFGLVADLDVGLSPEEARSRNESFFN